MGALPHSFKRIRLNLAHSKEFPQNSSLRSIRQVTSMRRCGGSTARPGASDDSGRVNPDEHGFLVYRGGPEHRRWVFDYDATAEDDDESGYRFGAHAFRPGEYVSVRSEEGEMHAFQITTVEPVSRQLT